MSHTVAEVSQQLNLSKVSIYTRLKTKALKEHITKRQGVTYVDQTGFNLIKDSLKDFKEDINDLKQDIPINEEIAVDTDYMNYLKTDITFLKAQLKEKDLQLSEQLIAKDLQINNLNERLKQEQELNKNSQILQLRQPQDIKQLEEHFENLDSKLIEIKDKMIERKEQNEKKSFLRRVFNTRD